MASKSDERGIDSWPEAASILAMMAFLFVAAYACGSVKTRGPVLLAGVMAAGVWVYWGVWGLAWRARHPGERMTYRTGPARGLLPPLIGGVLVVGGDMARRALHIGDPAPIATPLMWVLVYALNRIAGAILWRRFR